ncbi:HAD hydrolase-like protein [Exiguobacterium profundum]|uniref:HAD hydrolase-like protein n=1 Tax=Exiguobacterium profundum TaxID=307643 RepID=A0ABY8AZJ3_9BACL|nr:MULTISPECIES: HAD hydrolase-like protein [Exiguobacterium]WED55255.1 HAD hydrolase-like protein [Exiguobacterium profundum]
MKHAVIFDMDGTLFRTDLILELALDETFDYLRSEEKWIGPTPIDQYRNIMGVPLPVVWNTLLPQCDEQTREEVDAYFLTRLIKNIQNGNGALYAGVFELFERLNQLNHPIFIASNGLVDYLQAIVTHYELDRWITATYSIQQIDTLDKADLVAEIVNKYELQDGFVVGDRLSDISAARANGLISIGCRFDFAQEAELKEADYIVNHLSEVLDIVSKETALR